MSKTIYRGYYVEEQQGGSVWVSKDGEGRSFQNMASAQDWIDAERRKQIRDQASA